MTDSLPGDIFGSELFRSGGRFMKILLCAMGLDIGGAETHIVELALALRAGGNEVFVASGGGIYEAVLREAGVVCVNAPLGRRSPAAMIVSRRILSSLIRRERFDIVHAHARIPAFIAGPIARRCGVRFVTTAHSNFRVTPLLRIISDWGEHCFAVSRDIACHLRTGYGYDLSNVTIVPNGINTDVFSPAREKKGIRDELGISPSAELILHVSRLDDASSLCAEKLIGATKNIRLSYPGAVLLIVGAGTACDRVSSIADKLNASLGERAVILSGARSDVADIIAESDIFVGPSRAAMEAMASGKPTVVSGSQGHIGIFSDELIPECVRTNFCGRGLALPTEEVLCECVVSLLSMNAAERAGVGEKARRFICENYSVKKMTDIYLSEYRRIAKIKTGKHHDYTVCGYYGFGNVGDEMMAKAIVRRLRDEKPDADICIMSGSPKMTSDALSVSSVGRMNIFAIRKALKNTDTFIFGGGNLLQDKTSTLSLIYYTKMISMAKRLGCRVEIFANGIGPILRAKNRRRVEKALSLADSISMREEYSLGFCREAGKRYPLKAVPVLTDDPVLSVRATSGALSALGIKPEKYFVVAPKKLSASSESDYAKLIAKLKEKYSLSPVFIAMHGGEDKGVCRRLCDSVGGIFITEKLYGEEIAELLSGAEFSVCSRLHALILSRAVKVRSAVVTDDMKLISIITDVKYSSMTSDGRCRIISEFDI